MYENFYSGPVCMRARSIEILLLQYLWLDFLVRPQMAFSLTWFCQLSISLTYTYHTNWGHCELLCPRFLGLSLSLLTL